jgi:outer membrane lipoprotein-sorting protein
MSRTRHIEISWAKTATLAVVAMTATMTATIANLHAAADEAARKGMAIAIEADQRDAGFMDYTASVAMTLRSKNGAESHRQLTIKVLESRDDGDKSLIVFSRPRDINGTALLTFAHKTGNDDQWIYLPALKRVKRISATNRSGAFVGSEFAYEDLVRPEVERYTYRWLRDETIMDQPTHVVERTPAYKNSGYRRQIVWYDRAEFRILKIEYFDRNNTLLKRLSASNHREYKSRHWRPAQVLMTNLQNGKSTNLAWSNYKFRNGYGDGTFNKNKLKNSH